MNDVLMLFLLAGVLFICFCLIQSLRQIAASDSRRIRRCRQVVAVFIFDAVMLFSPVKNWILNLCFWITESETAKGFRDFVFVKRNYEMQYFLVCYIVMNGLILMMGFILFSIMEQAADRGRVYVFRKLDIEQKVLHVPWVLAELCYENRSEGQVLRPWAAVLGKWIRNLSDAILVLMGIQAGFGILSLYIRIEWLSGSKGMAVFSGWYLVPSVIWLTAIQVGYFLEYCPKERQDRQPKQEEEQDNIQKELFAAAVSGKSVVITKNVHSQEWLGAYLYDSFQKRRRLVIVCHTKEQVNQWNRRLTEILSKQYDRTCLIRFGSVIEMQNQQDVDILLLTLDELILLEIDRIFPFWYQQMQAVMVVDSHGILSHVGQETDVFFALWRRKQEPVQYLFFECLGNAQEKQALEYFIKQKIEVFGESVLNANELLAWELDSQKAKMRRMLLEMQKENGVSESWIEQKKMQFGMKGLRTEAFLKYVIQVVLKEYQIQNLYDSFLFIEETGQVQSHWYVRLTDSGIITRLNKTEKRDKRTDESILVGLNDTPIVCMEDQSYYLQDMAVLALGVEQEKKRLLLYQASMTSEEYGVFVWPEIGGVPDFSRESYYEKRPETQNPYEVTVLRMMFSMKDATDDREALSALLAFVCNQVLSIVFPYHTNAIRAGSFIKNTGRSIFCRILPEEEYEPALHCITIDLIETQSFEQGLTAVIRRNSKDFFEVCIAWLERAKDDPFSREAALFTYVQRQLGKDPDEYHAAQKLLELLV